MEAIINEFINGPNGRPIVYDFLYDKNTVKSPIVIFCHGYKGFKDWGAWPLLAKTLASKGVGFLKFNFSFNGGTLKNPIDFPDLKSFSMNNYSKELSDLKSVVDWVSCEHNGNEALDINNLILMGHSRGGGISTIYASEDKRIKKLITLAGVSNFEARFPKGEALKDWKSNILYYVRNTRTDQEMPHNFQFYNDFLANKDRLTISNAAKNLIVPHLIIHGDNDKAVNFNEAKDLKTWSQNSVLFKVKGANHVFGAIHPWLKDKLPSDLATVYTKIVDFINN